MVTKPFLPGHPNYNHPKPRLHPPAGVPERKGPSPKVAPPSGPGLPASRRRVLTRERRRRAHPAKVRERTQAQHAKAIVDAALVSLETGKSPARAAVEAGVDASGKSVKDIIKSAKEEFARRAPIYFDLHLEAARIASSKGDGEPAQWALEHLQADGEHAIEPVRALPNPGAVSIGIRIGGMPQPGQIIDTEVVTPAELPPMEAPLPEDLTP